MYNVSNKFTSAANSHARHIAVKALFNETTNLTEAHIMDLAVTEAVNASGGISMGATISSKLTMTIKMPDSPILLTNGSVRPRVGFYGVNQIIQENSSEGVLIASELPEIDSDRILVYPVAPELDRRGILTFAANEATAEYCPLGLFYITEATSNDDFKTVFKITAYDGFSKTEVKYSPAIKMPNTAEAILTDIAAQCGFELSPDISYPEGTFELYDWTCREYIGKFAGLLGKNARFNRDGQLTFVWYTNHGYSIPADLQRLGGFKRLTENNFVVYSITSGTENNQFTAGDGIGFSFDNPFMTQAKLDEIKAVIGTPTFAPSNIKWRGDPAVEAGDIIAVEDKNGGVFTVYVMEQTLKISGGLQSEIKCYGKSEEAIRFDTSPTGKKLQQVYTKLQDAITDATKLLSGGAGGVFEIIDENDDKINDGWIIHSADEQRFIKANLNGIGITTDGGATYKEAMTVNGINASAITVGSLNAERIAVENYDEENPAKLVDYIRFGNGTITLGKGDSAITLKLENNQIAFYNNNGVRLGRFTNNSFEIENLEEGQIRFQDFGYIPRASGNISFTKLK